MIILRINIINSVLSSYLNTKNDININFKISKISSTETVIEDIIIGRPPVLQIKKISLSYNFKGLINQTLSEVIVDGAELILKVNKDGKWSLPGKLSINKNNEDKKASTIFIPHVSKAILKNGKTIVIFNEKKTIIDVSGVFLQNKSFVTKGKIKLHTNKNEISIKNFLVVFKKMESDIKIVCSNNIVKDCNIKIFSNVGGPAILNKKKIKCEKLTISSNVNLKKRSIKAAFKITGLKHAESAKKRMFKDVSISGNASLLNNDITMKLNILGKKWGIRSDGSYNLKNKNGNLDYKLIPLVFSKNGVIIGDISPVLSQITSDLKGKVFSRGRITINDGKIMLVSSLKLKSLDGMINKTAFYNIDGLFKIGFVNNLLGLKKTILKIGKIHAATNITDIEIPVSFKNNKIILDKVTGKILGGRFEISKIIINPLKNENIEFELKIQKINLEKTMNVFLKDKVEATGTLSGVLPVFITDNAIIVKNGSLKSDQNGVFKYNSKGGPLQNNRHEQILMLLSYLEELHYKQFDFELSSDKSNQTILQWKIQGKGPRARTYIKDVAVRIENPLKFKMTLTADIFKILESVKAPMNVSDDIENLLINKTLRGPR